MFLVRSRSLLTKPGPVLWAPLNRRFIFSSTKRRPTLIAAGLAIKNIIRERLAKAPLRNRSIRSAQISIGAVSSPCTAQDKIISRLLAFGGVNTITPLSHISTRVPLSSSTGASGSRSEERRVGKEGRQRWATVQ